MYVFNFCWISHHPFALRESKDKWYEERLSV